MKKLLFIFCIIMLASCKAYPQQGHNIVVPPNSYIVGWPPVPRAQIDMTHAYNNGSINITCDTFQVSNGVIKYNVGAVNGYVLTTTSGGVASWQVAPGGTGSIAGTGITNMISKWSSSNTQTDSRIFDNGFSSIGFNTSSPATQFHFKSTSGAGILRNENTSNSSSAFCDFELRNDVGTSAIIALPSSTFNNSALLQKDALAIYNAGTGGLNLGATGTSGKLRLYTGTTERMRVDSTGNIGVGTTAPHITALFDVESTTKGFLFPQMTGTQRGAIVSPKEGLFVFDLTDHRPYYFNGTIWVQL